MKKVRAFLHIAIYFVLSYLVVAPFLKYGSEYIISFGESSLYLNPSYMDYLDPWNDGINMGDLNWHQSNLVLFVVLWKIFGFLDSIIHPSVTFIFLSFFLSCLFFYLSANKILKNRVNLNIIFLGGLFYSFNPFKLISPINERLHLIFIFLPLLFYLYHNLISTKKWKYVIYLVLFSFASSSIGANLPSFVILYSLPAIYFVFHLFHKKKEISKLVLQQNIVLLLGIFFINLFWTVPYVLNLFGRYESIKGSFSAISSGDFFDHFRFLGSWGWKSFHMDLPYYPFSSEYYKPPLLISTFAITLLTYFGLINAKLRKNYLYNLFLVINVLSLILLTGSKGPFGFVYDIFYAVPIFRMYREPFTKFTILYIISSAFLFIYSLEYLSGFIKSAAARYIVWGFLALTLSINVYPMFSGEFMPTSKWGVGQQGYMVKAPEYWKSASNYIRNLDYRSNMVIFPYSSYGNTHNWEFGTNIAGNAADFLIDFPILRGWPGSTKPPPDMLGSLYEKDIDYSFEKYLGLFNVRYILRENDVEWRYSDSVNRPTIVDAKLENRNINKLKDFGEFTNSNLRRILNEDTDPETHSDFYEELAGRPALELYELESNHVLGNIYSTDSAFFTNAENKEIKYLVSLPDYEVGDLLINSVHLPRFEEFKKKLNIYQALFPEQIEFVNSDYIISWDHGWLWPEPSVDPEDWRYPLVRIKEKLFISSIPDKEMKKFDVRLWLAAKRAAEVLTFDPSAAVRDKLVEELEDEFESLYSILKHFPKEQRDKSFWDMLNKYSFYLEVSRQKIPSEHLPSLKKSFLDWYPSNERRDCPFDICYELTPFSEGEYKAYIHKDDVSNISDMWLVAPDGLQTKVFSGWDGGLIPEESYFVDFGTYSLKQNQYYMLGINLTPLQENYASVVGEQKIPIQEWNEDSEYMVVIRMEKGFFDFDFSLVELYSDFKANVNKLSRFEKSLTGELCQIHMSDICSKGFVKVVFPTGRSSGAYIGVDAIVGKEEGGIVSVVIKKLLKPRIIFSKSEKHLPNVIRIEYSNPNLFPQSRYDLEIGNEIKSSFLVLNKNYSLDWKLRINNSNESPVKVNGYANAWYMGSNDKVGPYIVYGMRRVFTVAYIISGVVLTAGTICFGVIKLKSKWLRK
ncbi:hypothetical protein ACFL13_00720 [Patescibacteria group bacterium]